MRNYNLKLTKRQMHGRMPGRPLNTHKLQKYDHGSWRRTLLARLSVTVWMVQY